MKLRLVITGSASLSAAGHDSLGSLHSIRTSLSFLSAQPYPDLAKKWIVGGRIMTWTQFGRAERLRVLAERAFVIAANQAAGDRGFEHICPIGLIIASPESIHPGYRFPEIGFDARRWFEASGISSAGPVRVIQMGSCSAQSALQEAQRWLSSNEVKSCAIGAVDTQLQIRTLRWHENNYRLNCSYNVDGLMPAEGSCFLVVENEDQAVTRGAVTFARILSTAQDHEPAAVLTDRPNTATALTNAVRNALNDANVRPQDLDAVWCDLNGESYRAREWAFTEVRLGITDRTELIHPADCHGDLGAATDANLLALAAMAQATGWSHGKPQLVFSGSEGGIRAATVIGPPPRQPSNLLQVTEGEPRALVKNHVVPPLGPDDVDPTQSEDPLRTYFDWQLRQEHLEEIASLYYQRRTILHDSEVEWPRVAEPEQRILNHLDAVVAGGPQSIWAVASGLLAEEEGLCFAAALLLAVLPHDQNFEHLNRALDQPVATRTKAIWEAMRHTQQPNSVQRINKWLNHQDAAVQAMALSLLGELRLGEASSVSPFLSSSEPLLVRRAIEALRRRREVYYLAEIERHVRSDDFEIAFEALLAALCLRSQVAPDVCRELCGSDQATRTRAPILLAVCGNPWDLDVILRVAPSPALASADTLAALGVLGVPAATEFLLAALRADDDVVKVAAAEALELLTGAGLREEVMVSDEDVPELKHETLRVCTSPEQWLSWWRVNQSRFTADRRWRLGKPFSLSNCLDEIENPGTPYHRRQRAHWELVIHSGEDIPYEPDWFVPRQRRAIQQWRSVIQGA